MAATGLLRHVQTIRGLTALLLLALWLPATLHCGLEVAGAIESLACAGDADHGCATSSHCDADGCKVVEDGLYRSAPIVLKVAATPVVLSVFLICLHPLELDSVSEPVLSPARYLEPLVLTRTWQFVQRAALLPGAPSLVS